MSFDPADFSGNIVIAYGDANALRRGVAHAVLRDVLLHGPLDVDVSIDDGVDAWIEAFSQRRGEWLASAFGVPADAAASPIAVALRAVVASRGRALELVIDDEPCVDCMLAEQVVAAVADAAGVELLAPPTERIALPELEAWRDAQLTELPRWVDEALRISAASRGSIADAWTHLNDASRGTGLADLTAMVLFAERLSAPDSPAVLADGHAPDELVLACAHGTLGKLQLQPPHSSSR